MPRVNEELAQVRSKAQAEALAFHASLRKAQMQIESLEKAVEQKVRLGPPPPRVARTAAACPPTRVARTAVAWPTAPAACSLSPGARE